MIRTALPRCSAAGSDQGYLPMTVYLAAFAIFILFVGALALSFVFKKRAILSDDEAHAILEGMTCASCTSSACINAGRGLDLHGSDRCLIDNPRISHKNV